MKGIYGIHLSGTKLVYIGSTSNFEQRFNSHIIQLGSNNHHCRYLQNSWNKFGKSNFTFMILQSLPEETSKIHLENSEQLWMDFYHYNMKWTLFNTKDSGIYKVNLPLQTRESIISNHIEKSPVIFIENIDDYLNVKRRNSKYYVTK